MHILYDTYIYLEKVLRSKTIRLPETVVQPKTHNKNNLTFQAKIYALPTPGYAFKFRSLADEHIVQWTDCIIGKILKKIEIGKFITTALKSILK